MQRSRVAAHSRRAAVVAAVVGCTAVTVGVVAPPAIAAKGKRSSSTIVTLKIPAEGDITYGQAQVRIGKGPKSVRASRATLYRGRVGGLTVRATTKASATRRKALKVAVVASRVSGESSKLRNVTFLVSRKKGVKSSKKLSGTVRFQVANARPVVGSYWVKSAKRSGHARVFSQRNAIGTALGNWSKYLDVLDGSGARAAAHRAVDVHGQFRARPKPAADSGAHAASPRATASAGKTKKKSSSVTTIAGSSVWLGGKGLSTRTRKVLGLIFGTMSDRVAFQAAKNSPLATEFIRVDLGNEALAEKFEKTVAVLPLIVPDQYAAAAQEEARFTTVKKARISQSQVTVFDGKNASAQAAIEVPRSAADTAPGARIAVQLEGEGDVYEKARANGAPGGAIDCPQFTCSAFFPATSSTVVRFSVKARPGHEIKTLDGCTDGIKSGQRDYADCYVKIRDDTRQPTSRLAVRFGPVAAPPPASTPGTTAPTPTPPASPPAPAAGTLDATFGTGGLARFRLGAGRYPGFGAAEGGATGVLRQADGRILTVATGTDGDGHPVTYVTRHLPSGAIDTTFGALGVVEIDQSPGVMTGPEGEFIGRSLALQNGDIVVGGGFVPAGSFDSRFAALRLHGADGALDSGFAGGAAIATVDVGGSGEARDLVVDPTDGTIYLAGARMTSAPYETHAVFAALSSNGAGIGAFGSGGTFVPPFSDDAEINGLALHGHGLVAVGHLSETGGTFQQTALMMKVTKTGAFDPSFNGGAGLARPLGTGAYQTLHDVDVAPDGKIVAVGDGVSGAFAHCLGVRRVAADGTPDGSFASGSDVFDCPTQADDTSGGISVLVDGVGRIYAGGFQYDAGTKTTRALLGRLGADGTPDTVFGGGRVVLDTGSPSEFSQASTIGLDGGKPVIAGYAAPTDGVHSPQGTALDLLLARFIG